jgi:hypothetical protein
MKKIIFTLCVMVGVITAPMALAATSTSTLTVMTPSEIEIKVRSVFTDVPVMIEIARCESSFRQFTDSGNVFYGSGGMIGVFQFYEVIHSRTARTLGYDLATVDGNLGYARHLYEREGTTPWQSCVPQATVVDTSTEVRIKLMLQIIDLLQQLLALKLAER